jgi:hypothetical protein
MKLNPIAAEVLQANLAQALAISELLLSASEGGDDDQLKDWGAEVERLYIMIDDIRGVITEGV